MPDDLFVASHEDLFVLLTTLRGASAESLCALHFDRRPARPSRRHALRELRDLEALGYLERQHLHEGRCLWRLTAKGCASSPRVQRRATDAIRKPMSELTASYCWLRATLWAELTNRGYRVGRDLDAQRAIRRFLIDRQIAAAEAATGAQRAEATRVLQRLRADPRLLPLHRAVCGTCGTAGELGKPLPECLKCARRPKLVASPARVVCLRCGYLTDREERHESAKVAGRRCAGVMRQVDHVDFDVAWRPMGSTFEVILLVVDDPNRSIRRQLYALPLRVPGQPKVPVVLRTTDLGSVFNPKTGRWTNRGERHLELLRAFSQDGSSRLFPFSLTAEVIDVRPELQLRLRPLRKEPSHA